MFSFQFSPLSNLNCVLGHVTLSTNYVTFMIPLSFCVATWKVIILSLFPVQGDHSKMGHSTKLTTNGITAIFLQTT